MMDEGFEVAGGFAKYDLSDTVNLKMEKVAYPEGKYGGEMSFVPRTDSSKKNLGKKYDLHYIHSIINVHSCVC